MEHNAIEQFIRRERKAASMTQAEFVVRSGLCLHFILESLWHSACIKHFFRTAALLETNPDEDDTALTLHGKNQKIRRKNFLAFADTVGFPQKITTAIMNRMLAMVTKIQTMCDESFLPESIQHELITLIEERARRIGI